ncbi:MAG: LD-carboxypeptidase [Marinilabiliales bacterium]|nr:LD-carboxypeptidase [Marinilabiliales bacterium]
MQIMNETPEGEAFFGMTSLPRLKNISGTPFRNSEGKLRAVTFAGDRVIPSEAVSATLQGADVESLVSRPIALPMKTRSLYCRANWPMKLTGLLTGSSPKRLRFSHKLATFGFVILKDSAMKALVIPPYLREGDLISIITPASHIDQEAVIRAVDKLEESGFRVTLGEHVFSRSGPFAGTDDERLNDIQKATDDPPGKGGALLTRWLRHVKDSRQDRFFCAEKASQVVCRLQRYHLAAPVAQYSMRYRLASCRDAAQLF